MTLLPRPTAISASWRQNEITFLGWGLLFPGTSHYRAGCIRVAIVISLAEIANLYFINRGYRTAKVALIALFAIWILDLLGGWLVIRAFNKTGQSLHLDSFRRAALIVVSAIALGFGLERAVPPIPPAVLIRAGEKVVDLLSRKKPDGPCDPKLEECVKPARAPWVDPGTW